MKIAVDIFGGDNPPSVILDGCFRALREDKELKIIAVGDSSQISTLIPDEFLDRIEILDAKDVISCDENPTIAILKKRNSTIVKGMKYVKDPANNVEAFVSAGSTGALLSGAYVIFKKVEGIERPALAVVAPTFNKSKVVLIDAGANSECNADALYGFALMGAEYIKCIKDVKKPKVAILSNGTENEKGNTLVKDSLKLISKMSNIDFVGQMEARDFLSGKYDVVVSDGFSGNILLKASEGMAKGIFSLLKDIYMNTGFKGKLSALLIKKSLKQMKKDLDYSKNGGALFVGIDKIVIKVHGSSGAESIKNAILQAVDISRSGLNKKIIERV